MGADKSSQNTPNAQKLISPHCLPKSPKAWNFNSLDVRSPWIEPTKYYATAARPERTLSKAVIADL